MDAGMIKKLNLERYEKTLEKYVPVVDPEEYIKDKINELIDAVNQQDKFAEDVLLRYRVLEDRIDMVKKQPCELEHNWLRGQANPFKYCPQCGQAL